MITLFNKDGSIVPERPDVDNDDVKEIVIKQAVEDLFAERNCDFSECDKKILSIRYSVIGTMGVMNMN
ncbi:hypothetical protein [Enterovibrio nigricans]|uniref:Uncharacterized protein n=1 Tax=Enterovibrio nigricans DSM 22720 TaxID=1121868 RepID=A0A1T4UUZ8_9GAMM|nr:hypothetical protein [Enterovibrio nigricans]PKF50902.1 hypothetical protein AT251_07730 [Enterovibrio nigricans]SKA56549.1 hypothetical protein SAMN02745132_02580 [Enterovibrio nigricans DSM 22720]